MLLLVLTANSTTHTIVLAEFWNSVMVKCTNNEESFKQVVRCKIKDVSITFDKNEMNYALGLPVGNHAVPSIENEIYQFLA